MDTSIDHRQPTTQQPQRQHHRTAQHVSPDFANLDESEWPPLPSRLRAQSPSQRASDLLNDLAVSLAADLTLCTPATPSSHRRPAHPINALDARTTSAPISGVPPTLPQPIISNEDASCPVHSEDVSAECGPAFNASPPVPISIVTITPNGTRITITHDAIITESPGASSITPRFRPLASQPSATPKLLDALHPADNSHYVSHHRNSRRSLLALNLPEPNQRPKISLARRLTLMSNTPAPVHPPSNSNSSCSDPAFPSNVAPPALTLLDPFVQVPAPPDSNRSGAPQHSN